MNSDLLSQFHSHLAQSGAVFPEPQPAAPLHFGHAQAERAAAESSDVMFPWLPRTLIRAHGRDRAKFLHNFCTNDINGLKPGHGCEAFVTDVKSHILAHILVFAREDDMLISCGAATRESLLTHLNRYVITEDVEFEDRSDNCLQLLWRQHALADDQTSLWQTSTMEIAGKPLAATPVPVWDGTTVLLLVELQDAHDAIAVWDALRGQNVRPIGSDAAEDLRILAGFPRDGIDVNSEMLAQEADRTTQAICFTKGCYLGQEPIARIDALGHVNRVLRRVAIAGDACPDPGAAILSADGAEVGRLRSVSPLAGAEHRAALALLRTQHAASGTELQLAGAPAPIALSVM